MGAGAFADRNGKESLDTRAHRGRDREGETSMIRVLIIDDSVVVRRFLSDLLAAESGMEVAGIAPNGRIGLAKIAQTVPGVVVLDLEMPEMDGLETLTEIRSTWPNLPVIMYSSLTKRGAIATLDALELGANDYVTKPSQVGSMEEAASRVRAELIPKIRRWSLGPCHRPDLRRTPDSRPVFPDRFPRRACSANYLDRLRSSLSDARPEDPTPWPW